MSEPLSAQLQDQLVAAYQSGLSSAQVATRFGVCSMSVRNALIRQGIPRRSKYKVIPVNNAFFSEIATESQAYWLGFLVADGCVSDSGWVSLGLAARDRGHLEAFRIAVRSDHPIREKMNRCQSGTYPTVDLGFTSRQMASDLAACGVTPRKSMTCQPWQGPDSLMRHYWRGVLDGDGCIGSYGTRRNPTVNLIGSESVMKAFANFVRQETGAARSPIRKRNWIYQISGTNAVKVIHVLYDGATVALPRKMALAQEAMNWKRVRKVYRDWSTISEEQLCDLYVELGTWERVGARFGVTKNAMDGIIKYRYPNLKGLRRRYAAVSGLTQTSTT